MTKKHFNSFSGKKDLTKNTSSYADVCSAITTLLVVIALQVQVEWDLLFVRSVLPVNCFKLYIRNLKFIKKNILSKL